MTAADQEQEEHSSAEHPIETPARSPVRPENGVRLNSSVASAYTLAAEFRERFGDKLNSYARRAIRIGRFLSLAATIPQAALSFAAMIVILILTLFMRDIVLSWVYGILGVGFGLGGIIAIPRLKHHFIDLVADRVRYILTESGALKVDLLREIRGVGEAGQSERGSGSKTDWLSFLRLARRIWGILSASGELVLPVSLSVARMRFVFVIVSMWLVAWLPLGLALLITDASWLTISMYFFASAVLSLPPISLLLLSVITGRAALFLGIAEGLLDIPGPGSGMKE
ncbi:hypothetical protein IIA79_00660 [bacterium]|nr:hypothetical protein [bacterium]